MNMPVRLLLPALLLGSGFLAGTAGAHPVTVDGNPGEWMTRLPNVDNVGILARNATGCNRNGPGHDSLPALDQQHHWQHEPHQRG